MKNNHPISLFWFRQDLRILDNPGLSYAAQQGKVLPIYILDDESAGDYKIGGASRVWLHHSLTALNHSLDNKLNVYMGHAELILLQLIQQYNIQAVYWNRCYEPWRIKQDSQIKTKLKEMQIECKSFNASLLWEPWTVLKKDGTYYKVYTPFYRQCQHSALPREPVPKPKELILIKDRNNHIQDLNLLSHHPWQQSIASQWKIGEKAAHNTLQQFFNTHLRGYKKGRDYPAQAHTSLLSPHLHFGELSPHQVWHSAHNQKALGLENDLECFFREIAWREFSYYLLYHFPDLPIKNFQAKFDLFNWRKNSRLLSLWQQGKTGYPIVDAGMRELWQTGYMHNRVRMIVASFLIKNLRIHWHCGEQWFWDCLVDADLANNSASWQWVAGSGADAAPFFRIFNPITQSEKFDPQGEYIHRFVPELRQLPPPYLFKPWEASQAILAAAGITLGKTYPKPIIDLKASRTEALESYRNI